jgi:hypothetical protein
VGFSTMFSMIRSLRTGGLLHLKAIPNIPQPLHEFSHGEPGHLCGHLGRHLLAHDLAGDDGAALEGEDGAGGNLEKSKEVTGSK